MRLWLQQCHDEMNGDQNLADNIRVDAEVDVLHVDSERYDDKTSREVYDGQRDDVDCRHETVFATGKHAQYQSIPGSSSDAQHCQHV